MGLKVTRVLKEIQDLKGLKVIQVLKEMLVLKVI
jgi:hypothetical protein